MDDRPESPAADAVAIVPAAGAGTRLPGPVPKPYRRIGGETILGRTVRTLAAAPSVGAIVVAAAEQERARAAGETAGVGVPVTVIAGGETRSESVGRALAGISGEASIVVVHDGVRPFLTVREIEETIAAAREGGGAIVASAPVETVKETEEGAVVRTLDRKRIRLAQTPQAFRIELLRCAYEKAGADGGTATDESALVERLGESVAVVEADPLNRKITTEADLRWAEWIVREGYR